MKNLSEDPSYCQYGFKTPKTIAIGFSHQKVHIDSSLRTIPQKVRVLNEGGGLYEAPNDNRERPQKLWDDDNREIEELIEKASNTAGDSARFEGENILRKLIGVTIGAGIFR